MRRPPALIAVLLTAAAAGAQTGQIVWQHNAAEGVATAKQTGRPLLFYLNDSVCSRCWGHDIKQLQQRAFRDPRVVYVAQRFVPVDISASAYPQQLKHWGLGPKTHFILVVTTPDGEKLATISSPTVAQPKGLADALHGAYDKFRDQLYKDEIEPVLKNEKAKAGELRAALRRIDALQLSRADQAVADLLKRTDLDKKLFPDIYRVLARLSTEGSVSTLLRQSDTDKAAADALDDCTPAGAEHMLLDLGDKDAERHLLVYKAVTKICHIPAAKNDRFWTLATDEQKAEEIERVRDLATKAAARWKNLNPYR